jgi:hypothetical protein
MTEKDAPIARMSTVARMAGNIAAGLVMREETLDIGQIARTSVELAMTIIEEIKAYEPHEPSATSRNLRD